MNNQLENAKKLLNENGYTCIVIKDEEVYFSTARGVKPLLNWLDEGKDLTGFSVADKVVGKGAAMLYVLLNVKEIYALVISQVAYDFLKEHNIDVYYETLVDRIVNRTKTGFCPIEEAVIDILDTRKAVNAIKDKLEQLNK